MASSTRLRRRFPPDLAQESRRERRRIIRHRLPERTAEPLLPGATLGRREDAGALAKLDKPVALGGLKSAKVELTLSSKAKYAEERKKHRLDEAKIAKIREAKARG